jgi:hypothetical protein
LILKLQEIYKDRKKFSKAVFEVASSDLVNMGICVVSYTLKDIRDDKVILHCQPLCLHVFLPMYLSTMCNNELIVVGCHLMLPSVDHRNHIV